MPPSLGLLGEKANRKGHAQCLLETAQKES